MRQAINENRTVQLALVAVLALAGAFMLLKGGGSSASSAADTSAAPAPVPGTSALPPPGTGVAATPAPVATSGTASATTATAVAGTAAAGPPPVPADLVPGPGLPKGMLAAYKRGDAVALLVTRAGATDDALVRGSLGLLDGLDHLAVYSTKAKHVARYSWLTQGVDLSDLPALVILLPRANTDGAPTASVSYGFRGPASVLQAARDALYRGPTDLPYHP
jgi:hypothetical protein